MTQGREDPAQQPEPTRRNRASKVRRRRWTLALLTCGILSSLLYAAMLVFVPLGWPSYDSASWTVSELSAIDAPTRSAWVAWGRLWTLLYFAFGLGVWRAASESRALRIAGGAIAIAALFGVFWPPMHLREVLAAGGASLTDTLHIVWTAVNGALTLLAMGFVAGALRGPFRIYSIASMLTLVAAGVLTSVEAPRVDANLPTPWIGVWERVNIGAWLAWLALFALVLIRRSTAAVETAHTEKDARERTPHHAWVWGLRRR